MMLAGAIEAGGTKFVCAVGSGPEDIRAEERFPTTSPDETMGRVIGFFTDWQKQADQKLEGIGVASFGPIDCNRKSSRFGWITTTPKPGWKNVDLLGPLKEAFGVPLAFDTDVNGAALSEWRWGAARGRKNCLYLTIGTGIGGGYVAEGKTLKGLTHPEMGHITVPHDSVRDPFKGACPFHGDCLEGLASGPAIEKRWGCKAIDLPADHEAWALEAFYLGRAVSSLILTLTPTTIVMGGGVMEQEQLFPLVRDEVKRALNGYIDAPEILNRDPEFITPPGLGNRSGLLGGIALIQEQITLGP